MFAPLLNGDKNACTTLAQGCSEGMRLCKCMYFGQYKLLQFICVVRILVMKES